MTELADPLRKSGLRNCLVGIEMFLRLHAGLQFLDPLKAGANQGLASQLTCRDQANCLKCRKFSHVIVLWLKGTRL
ncbi:hypothetical protein ABIF90_007257 [Bradyrhizobium japonicum]